MATRRTWSTRLLAGAVLVAVAAPLAVPLMSVTADDPRPVLLLDVRDRASYDAGHLLGARYAGEGAAAALAGLAPDRVRVAICCTPQSGPVVDQLARRGWTDLVDLGYLGQASDATGLPIVTADDLRST